MRSKQTSSAQSDNSDWIGIRTCVLWYTWICKHGVGLQKKTPITPNVGGSGSIIVVYDRLDGGLVTLVDHNAEADEAGNDRDKAAEDAGKKRTRPGSSRGERPDGNSTTRTSTCHFKGRSRRTSAMVW
jgi:hypothetical protein